MKKMLIAMVLVAGSAVAEDSIVVGHMYLPAEELEFYSTTGSCEVPINQRTEVGGFYLSRYPHGLRSQHTMGCWKPLGNDRIRAIFNDGKVMILERKRLIPTGEEERRFSL